MALVMLVGVGDGRPSLEGSAVSVAGVMTA